MHALKAVVKNGRLTLDEPTRMPDGTEVELLAADEDFDPEERSRLLQSIEDGFEDMERGDDVDGFELIARLRAKREAASRETSPETGRAAGGVVGGASAEGAVLVHGRARSGVSADSDPVWRRYALADASQAGAQANLDAEDGKPRVLRRASADGTRAFRLGRATRYDAEALVLGRGAA